MWSRWLLKAMLHYPMSEHAHMHIIHVHVRALVMYIRPIYITDTGMH